MPGSPDPVLGSEPLTVAAAALLAAVVVGVAVLSRDRLPNPPLVAVAGGLAYGIGCVTLWAGVRAATGAFASSIVENPGVLAVLVVVGTLAIALQAAIPVYLYVSRGIVAPMVALFLATTLVAYLFLRVRGESDPLGLYVLFSPAVISAVSVLGGLELGVRYLSDRSALGG